MEIVSIERKTFEAMVAKFDRFVSRMDAICHRHGEKKMSEWMDNQDVCRMKTCSASSLLWRTGERKRSSKVRLYKYCIE